MASHEVLFLACVAAVILGGVVEGGPPDISVEVQIPPTMYYHVWTDEARWSCDTDEYPNGVLFTEDFADGPDKAPVYAEMTDGFVGFFFQPLDENIAGYVNDDACETLKWVPTTTSTNWIFSHGAYDGVDTYDNDASCSWLMRANDVDRVISLTVWEYDIQEADDNGDCTHDSLAIYDGATDQAPLLREFCGSSTTKSDDIISSGMEMFVKFKTDGSIVYTGFNASFHAVSPSDGRSENYEPYEMKFVENFDGTVIMITHPQPEGNGVKKRKKRYGSIAYLRETVCTHWIHGESSALVVQRDHKDIYGPSNFNPQGCLESARWDDSDVRVYYPLRNDTSRYFFNSLWGEDYNYDLEPTPLPFRNGWYSFTYTMQGPTQHCTGEKDGKMKMFKHGEMIFYNDDCVSSSHFNGHLARILDGVTLTVVDVFPLEHRYFTSAAESATHALSLQSTHEYNCTVFFTWCAVTRFSEDTGIISIGLDMDNSRTVCPRFSLDDPNSDGVVLVLTPECGTLDDPEDHIDCGSHGKCVVSPTYPHESCQCDEGWTGHNCEIDGVRLVPKCHLPQTLQHFIWTDANNFDTDSEVFPTGFLFQEETIYEATWTDDAVSYYFQPTSTADACSQGSQVLTAESGVLSSPNYPAYYDGQLGCSWIILAPPKKKKVPTATLR